MLFGKKESPIEVPTVITTGRADLLLVGPGLPAPEQFSPHITFSVTTNLPEQLAPEISYVISSLTDSTELSALQCLLHNARKIRNDGLPVLVQIVHSETIRELGDYLSSEAVAERLSGVRLLPGKAPTAAEILERCRPLFGSNVIKMPIAPEVQNSGYKYFYSFTPLLDNVVRMMGELAENNITRVYLLGAPGTGKTSLAYYFFLQRNKGNFVTVNLSSESTGDKSAMKSLLCGHVAGAIAGGSAREGALSFARDGVCFLDESHGVTGSVMQVLMEVLESNQFLPFGATAKRLLECAVVFASNRRPPLCRIFRPRHQQPSSN